MESCVERKKKKKKKTIHNAFQEKGANELTRIGSGIIR